MRQYRIGLAALAALVVLGTQAGAQPTPSANQIIDQLKPSAQTLQGASSRGIRPIGPSTTTGSADVVKAAKSAGGHAAEAPSLDLYVPFDTGSAELTPAAIAALDELGKALTSPTLSGFRFKIEGHTDTVGSKGYNQTLSERRADAVTGYLEQKYGLSQKRLVTVGLGSDHLLVPTPEQTAEPRNRRVTVINLGA